MNSRILFYLSIVLLMSGCSTKVSRSLGDPFASGLQHDVREPIEVWRFIVNPHYPQPIGTDATYTDVSQFDDSMDPIEMAILRYLHGEGVDFMGIPSGVVSISKDSQSVFMAKCLCHSKQNQFVIFVRQTIPNLKRIKQLVESFGEKVDTEIVEIKQK